MYERLTLNLVAAHRTCLVVSVFRVSRLLSHVPMAFTSVLVPSVVIAYIKERVNVYTLMYMSLSLHLKWRYWSYATMLTVCRGTQSDALIDIENWSFLINF